MTMVGRLYAGRAGAALAAALLLGACSATGVENMLPDGSAAPKPTHSTDAYTKAVFCPPLQIRGGTEAMTVYERGHENDPAFVRFLASITRTARECRMDGTNLVMKVGVAGRVVAGPKGGPGSLTLPVRIAVAKQVGGKGPVYTQLFKIPVTVGGSDFSAEFDQVFDGIAFPVSPDDRDLIAYAGFDEGAKK
jgi:hypothetical protein